MDGILFPGSIICTITVIILIITCPKEFWESLIFRDREAYGKTASILGWVMVVLFAYFIGTISEVILSGR